MKYLFGRELLLFISEILLVGTELMKVTNKDGNSFTVERGFLNTEIKNYLGFYGSYTSDLFFQSIGLIAYLVPLTRFLYKCTLFIKRFH